MISLLLSAQANHHARQGGSRALQLAELWLASERWNL
jgi:hypothetical protein